jgi:CRP-like cAMP-binding protein
MQTYRHCFVAGEGVEWLRHWLREHHRDDSADSGHKLFVELLAANLFEVLEQDQVYSIPQETKSFVDAFVFCRFVDGGGAALLEAAQLADSNQPAPPVDAAKFYLDTDVVKAVTRIQENFRANKLRKQAQRFSKVMTRKLAIRVPDEHGQGEVLGELVLRCVWQQTDPNQLVKLDDAEGFEARPDGFEMLRDHGASKNVDWHSEYYEKDPNYLLGGTMFKAPPLKRLMHVYGTGLDTLWSFIYRSKNGVEIKKEGPCSLGVELDPTADHLGDMNYKMKDGLLYETKHALQHLPDAPDQVLRNSGDGTVPYQSLRYSQTWDSPTFLSQTIELEGSKHEHREILASREFHNCLTEYLTDTVAVYIIEAKDLKSMDANGLSDPYCAMYAVGPTIKRSKEKRKTAVFSKTLNPVFNERHVFGTEFDLGNIESIVIDVMDHDHASKDDLIGRVTIDINDLELSPTKALNGWCPLRNPRTGKGGLGVLRIHAELEGAGQSSMGVKDNMIKAAGCQALSNASEVVEPQGWDAPQLDDDFDALGAVDLFKGLRAYEQAALRAGLTRRIFHHGDTIIKQGELSSDFFLIEDGLCEVSISSTGPGGEALEEVISTLNHGQHFGEMALLPGDPKPRTASVTAMTTVECLCLTRETFNAVTNSELASGTVHIGGLKGVSGRKARDEKTLMRRMAEYGEVLTAVIRYRQTDKKGSVGNAVLAYNGEDEHVGDSWALVSFASPEAVDLAMADGIKQADGTVIARISSCFSDDADGSGDDDDSSIYVQRVDSGKAMASMGALPLIFAECRDRVARLSK